MIPCINPHDTPGNFPLPGQTSGPCAAFLGQCFIMERRKGLQFFHLTSRDKLRNRKGDYPPIRLHCVNKTHGGIGRTKVNSNDKAWSLCFIFAQVRAIFRRSHRDTDPGQVRRSKSPLLDHDTPIELLCRRSFCRTGHPVRPLALSVDDRPITGKTVPWTCRSPFPSHWLVVAQMRRLPAAIHLK